MATETFTNPGPEALRALFARMRTIAVVGLSPKPGRPSHFVAAAMQRAGFRIVPVRPAVAEVLGEPAYAELAQVPGPIDLVNVFRNPSQIGPVVDACIERQVPALWLQEGVVNPAEALRAQRAGMLVVMDRCLAVEYRNLMG